MSDISVLTAFLGGALSVLPACGPALVPAFFAYAFAAKGRLLLATILFIFGFSVVFIPFGLGVRFVVDILIFDRIILYQILGTLLVLWGIVILFGFGFPASGNTQRLLPRSGLWLAFAWGLLFGFTSGACSAPIFGAIATLAAGAGTLPQTFLLLIVFVLGMSSPLFLLALFISTFGTTKISRFLRIGFEVSMGKWVRKFFVMNIIVGLLCIMFGVSFLQTRSDWFLGTSAVTDWFLDVNERLLR